MRTAPLSAKKWRTAQKELKSGRLEEAAAACLHVVTKDRRFAPGWALLGEIRLRQGHGSEAKDALEQAIGLGLKKASTLHTYGAAVAALGRTDEAAAIWEQVIERFPKHAPTRLSLGTSYQRRGEAQKAMHHFEQALRWKPDCVEAAAQLGYLLLLGRRRDEALGMYLRALELRPGYLPALEGLAHIYERQSQLEEAESAIRTALRKPDPPARLYLQLALILLRRRRLSEVNEVLDQVAGRPMRPEDRANYWRRRADAAHELGEHAEAFALYEKANAETLSLPAAQEALQSLDRPRGARQIYAWYQGRLASGPIEPGDAPEPPREPDFEASLCFFMGFPRSGTTLVETIVGAHSRVRSLSETSPMNQLALPFMASPELLEHLTALSPKDRAMLRGTYHHGVRVELEREVASRSKPAGEPEAPLLGPDTLVFDKHPLHTLYYPLLRTLFPEAKLVFALRDPRDVILSCFTNDFRLNPSMVRFLSMPTLVEYYTSVMGAFLELHRTFPQPIYFIRYEDIVEDAERETHALLDFLGLSWEPGMAAYRETSLARSVRTASYAQVVEPIHRKAQGRWKKYADQLQPYMDALQPLVDGLGYGSDGTRSELRGVARGELVRAR